MAAEDGCQKPILFITSSDHGQANVILAVAGQLAHHSASSFAIHIASTAKLAPRVDAQLGRHVKFHLLPGHSMFGSYLEAGHRLEAMLHRPGIAGAISSFNNVSKMNLHWMNGGYMALYKTCVRLLQELAPAVVVLDPVCAPEIDACRILGQKLVILFPQGLKDLLGPVQPWAGMLWKYPALSSGYPFPLPIHLILANVYILIRLVVVCLLPSSSFREIAAVRKAAGIPGNILGVQSYVPQGTHYLVPDLPELSLPLAPIPSNVTACGPIVPLSMINEGANQSAKQLLEWMSGRKTVVVNLGSNIAPGRSYCESLARALELVLRKHKDLSVLWKLKRDQGTPLDESLTDTLGDALNKDRMKIVEWLEVDPAHLLMLEGVVVSVHHGGANAYFETARAGVPQVILPVWYDTYSNATCAEYLNIGVYANKSCAPDVSDTELGEALCMLLDENNVRGRKIRATAQTLGERCRREEGRKVAADVIIKIARGEM